ncbi:hypothetical protein I3760_05G207300 [Carya illinoinensis]|nr:hypothetical protein I3760_05G207300 [Carya illinoinensis]
MLRITKFGRLSPIHEGTISDKLFPPKSMVFTLLQLWRDVGIFPTNPLLLKCKTLIQAREPIESGIFPYKFLLAKLRTTKSRLVTPHSIENVVLNRQKGWCLNL